VHRYPQKTLKERLRYKPVVAFSVDSVTAESANTNAMDNTAAGIKPNLLFISALD
jgi:hypothetical protein